MRELKKVENICAKYKTAKKSEALVKISIQLLHTDFTDFHG
ncbi:hypothetical protein HNQ03_000721 [Chryseobacterium sp. 16F]|uniref:Uncharacterized protein n=1 Tax=Frigoriflavimonas asaccharolytica TaxID=2735899 RepID=A0A8J8KAN0_9FLAO|nr:hypothetical protein [Frigoriflavimonas asaccharolytica]